MIINIALMRNLLNAFTFVERHEKEFTPGVRKLTFSIMVTVLVTA
jgi:hypothetical protein